ncbi:acyl-CoA dehydrogenase family protein [Williamsia sterculiae]|uniref:Acyl-CoA dehydrogenase, middle domain n=1 Tax=Williamsia sterculiae TaxID=1344003 RepID=A0A1N7G8X8_9NOCA|nr:acyl-CoA dehydrogenase family protein [Williamsia sterculiae]SIS09039.1 Acyl-CoA dehydrogenase, middle domain [Williamsia sterculiae]
MTDAGKAARAILGAERPGTWVPRPGSGATVERFRYLAEHTRDDIPVGRVLEAHLDAVVIAAELDGPVVGDDQLWGVWAAEPPSPLLTARRNGGRWTLCGTKPWCSAASSATHALVTARVGDTRPLFAVDLAHAGIGVGETSWHAAGMSRTDTRKVHFDGVPGTPVGGADDYLRRPGFWHGGVGVAACWLGGATGVADRLRSRVTADPDPILLAQLGCVDAWLATGAAALRDAAAVIDADPRSVAVARRTAMRTRWVVEQVAGAVTAEVGEALGPGPLVTDAAHAARVADLTVYLRQSHGVRDLVDLGRVVAGTEPGPVL